MWWMALTKAHCGDVWVDIFSINACSANQTLCHDCISTNCCILDVHKIKKLDKFQDMPMLGLPKMLQVGIFYS